MELNVSFVEANRTFSVEFGESIDIGLGSYDEGYDRGYAEGEADGWTIGYDEGYDAGETKGKADGYNDGYGKGKTDGYGEGYEKGFVDGEAASGGGDTATKYATQLNRSFYNADFPEGYELAVDVHGTTNLAEMFRNAIGLEKLTVRCPESAVIAANYFLYTTTTRASSLEELTLPDGIKFSNFANFASRCSKLKTINGKIDLGRSSSNNDCFSYCPELQDIRFVSVSILKDISFAQSPKLSDESITSIINGLSPDAREQTLTVHPDVAARIIGTDITDKGWSLAY